MEKGFTLVEVVILFVIFLTVAVLVIPLSIEDTIALKNTEKWEQAQNGFSKVSCNMSKNSGNLTRDNFIIDLEKVYPLRNTAIYPVKYMNGAVPDKKYRIKEFYNTNNGAAIAVNWFDDENNQKANASDGIYGIIVYDVNGKRKPNIWGKDIFGLYIYDTGIEPIGKNEDNIMLEIDCSKQGTGLYCSSYYLRKERD